MRYRGWPHLTRLADESFCTLLPENWRPLSRRRILAWPAAKSVEDTYALELAPKHVPHYLDAVLHGVAACVGLRAAFIRGELPLERRSGLRFELRFFGGRHVLLEAVLLPKAYAAKSGYDATFRHGSGRTPPSVVQLQCAPRASVCADTCGCRTRLSGRIDDVAAALMFRSRAIEAVDVPCDDATHAAVLV